MASARHRKDSGRQLVAVPTSHGNAWLDLLSYISKSSSRPYRLVRERLVNRMQAVPDLDRTDSFDELLKQYENERREHIPDTDVRLVLLPVIREALPKQFRCPPWIPEKVHTPRSCGGSAHAEEDRRDLEGIMSEEDQSKPVEDQPMPVGESEAMLAEILNLRKPLDQLGALRELYKARASFAEVDLWSLSSRLNVALKAVLDNLAEITDNGKAPLVRKFVVMTQREIPRALVVEMIIEFLTDLGVHANKGSPGPNT